MRKLLLSLTILLFCTPLISALQVRDITFIPDKNHLSKNSPFILIVDFDENKSLRVEWAVSEGLFELNKYGGIPKVNGRFVCFFSTHEKNNCGPPIFIKSDTYNLQIIAVNEKQDFVIVNSSDPKLGKIKVGGILFQTEIQEGKNTIYVTTIPSLIVNWVKYKVYDTDFNEVKEGTFEKGLYNLYFKNITLSKGEYYLSIYAESDADKGGYVVPITIGEVHYKKAKYDIEATDVDLTGFNSILLKRGQKFRKGNYRLINKKNETISNISIIVNPNISKYISIKPQNDTIPAGRSVYFTFELHNIQTAMEIRTIANIVSNSKKVGEINIRVDVGIEGKQAISQMIEIVNPVWIGDYIVGEVSQTFSIKNKGETPAENITYDIPVNLKNIIKTINHPTSIPSGSTEKINITIESFSPGRKTGILTISTDIGTAYIFIDLFFFEDISIEISNIETKLNNLKDKLSATQRAEYSSLISEVENALSNSNIFFNSGNYVSAERELEKAKTVLDAIETITGSATEAYCGDGVCDLNENETVCPEDCGDIEEKCGDGFCDPGEIETCPEDCPKTSNGNIMVVILIVILIIIIAVSIWFYFTKIRTTSWEEEIEEEYY